MKSSGERLEIVCPLSIERCISHLIKRVRVLVIIFVAGLVISGLTAFPLKWELDILKHLFVDNTSFLTDMIPQLSEWIAFVYRGVSESYQSFPFMAYGTDWLGFAHIVIAVAFWGPIRDPLRNVWVIEFGIIACVLVVPFAMIAGSIRGIPLGWQFVDSLFGIVGIIPLWLARNTVRQINLLEKAVAL